MHVARNEEKEKVSSTPLKLNFQTFSASSSGEFFFCVDEESRSKYESLDLPLTSSSSMVVLESVDSFSFACDPSLFFAIMLLPLPTKVGDGERWKKKRNDYDNEMLKKVFG